MPEARRLYQAAQRCMGRLGGDNAGRLVLSLLFKAILGIQRIVHFESITDPGIALLTGGRTKVVSRSRLGALLRRVGLASVRRFMSQTAPRMARAACHCISIDEHAIARFTRKFDIRKGFHTIRNKKMKVEKLTFAFDIATRRLCSLVVSAGHETLVSLAKRLIPSLRRRARGAPVRLVLDAGAAHNHEALLELVEHPNQVTLVRTPRRRSYRTAWQALPAQAWTALEEPGPYTGAAPKAIVVADTRTALAVRSRSTPVSVRTIVIRETARRGTDRWHAIWVFGDEQTAPYQLVREFRGRQHHEQTYRIMLHDLAGDAAPSGYNKRTRPHKPGFQQNALTLYGWIAALAVNALLAFTTALPERFHHAHPRTLRRWFFHVPAELYLGHDTLIVSLHPTHLRPLWQHLIAHLNRRALRIPWLEQRRLVLSLDRPMARRMPEMVNAATTGARSVWC